jgi:hypothetical protein
MIKELREKYPLISHPLFPGKHIYTDPTTGYAWELTPVRFDVWASHIV